MKHLILILFAALLLTPAARAITLQADTITVQATKMNRPIKNVVTLPARYLTSGDTARYPVLYLLHGAWGSYRDWPTKADLKTLASRYDMIIVCPDGQDSWYFDSPIDPAFQFETYVSRELVAYIDSHYRTWAMPGMRAIAGLSMGGQGALRLAFLHPDVYGTCCSMSGGVDITHFPGKWKIQDRLGPYDTNKQRWASHAVVNLVDSIKPGLRIWIDDGLQDIFINENNALHAALDQRAVPHVYLTRPGNHSWTYWLQSLPLQADFIHQSFLLTALRHHLPFPPK